MSASSETDRSERYVAAVEHVRKLVDAGDRPSERRGIRPASLTAEEEKQCEATERGAIEEALAAVKKAARTEPPKQRGGFGSAGSK